MAVLVKRHRVATRPRVRPARPHHLPGPAGLGAAPLVPPSVVACAPLRRRGRVVALLTAALLTAVAAACLLWLQTAVAAQDVPSGVAVVEVRRGESLWDLARRVAPDSSPPAVVARIRQLNGMSGSTVHPGQPLLVPDDG